MGGRHEARQREEGTNGCGVMHAVTLLQNLYQFQAGENARNVASGKAIMQDRTTEGPTRIREDPLTIITIQR